MRFMVKTATSHNGDTETATKKPSQNGDKPYNECKYVCVDVNAVSVTVVVHICYLKFHPRDCRVELR